MNLERSVLHGRIPEQIFVKIEHREPTLIQQILIRNANGEEQLQTFTLKVGEETSNSAGGISVQCCARWEGRELVIESRMKTTDRELHFKDYWSLSNDNALLTMAHRDDDLAGQITLLERGTAEDSSRFD